MQSIYGEVAKKVSDKMRQVKLLICDIDGVFSDGRIYLGNDGEELKAFNTLDGFGVKALINSGVEVAVITGRNSDIVKNRMTSLTVKYIYQGRENKVEAFEELLKETKLNASQVAYIGDDVPDLKVMQLCQLAVAVDNAHPLVANAADYITQRSGGFGAVREICDLLMEAQGASLTPDGKSQ